MKNYNKVKSILSEIEPSEIMYSRISEEDIASLERMLLEQEAWLASRAVFALSRLKSKQAIDILEELANNPRIEVRVALAAATENLPLNISEDILSKLIKDKEIGVRKFAYQKISVKHTPHLIEQLHNAINEENNLPLKEILNEKILEINKTQ